MQNPPSASPQLPKSILKTPDRERYSDRKSAARLVQTPHPINKLIQLNGCSSAPAQPPKSILKTPDRQGYSNGKQAVRSDSQNNKKKGKKRARGIKTYFQENKQPSPKVAFAEGTKRGHGLC
jgi:hypothetical protein